MIPVYIIICFCFADDYMFLLLTDVLDTSFSGIIADSDQPAQSNILIHEYLNNINVYN